MNSLATGLRRGLSSTGTTGPIAFRCASSNASEGVNVDWEFIKSRMVTDESRNNIDRLRDSFKNRLSTARSVGTPPKINWEFYKKHLSHIDVDKLRQNFEQYMASIPDIKYDEAADAQKHVENEKSWEGVAQYAQARVEELEKLKEEGEEHKLHDYYTVTRAFQRFDGLLEKEWLEWRNLNFESNLRSSADIQGELSAEDEEKIVERISERAGVEKKMLDSSK